MAHYKDVIYCSVKGLLFPLFLLLIVVRRVHHHCYFVKYCSCVHKLLRGRKDSVAKGTELQREKGGLCNYVCRDPKREREELCKAYQLTNRRSNSCGGSYQRVVNHVKPVCLCMFSYACIEVFA